MPSLFRTGTHPLAIGADELSVAGLDLPFTPGHVSLTLRRPAADAPTLSAFLHGAPTADGFSLSLSAPVPSAGYLLDWCAYAAEYDPGGAGSASGAISYADLLAAVARYLGYDPAALSEREQAECDAHVQSGVRQFYYPPAVQGCDPAHEWSFLRAGGTVTTLPGEGSAPLPAGFGRIRGDVECARPDGRRHLLRALPEADIRRLLATPGPPAPPRAFCPVWSASLDASGQAARLLLWPVPDASYSLSFAMEADAGRLSADLRPHPLGGPRHAELVLESCLAVAEQRSNDEAGIHTRLFREMLPAAQAQDRRFGAALLGPMSAPPRPDSRAPSRVFPITYKGATW